MDVGAEAVDYNQLVKSEQLKPMEAELRKLEQVAQEIVDEMEYLRKREARMRDTNGSFYFLISFVNRVEVIVLIQKYICILLLFSI